MPMQRSQCQIILEIDSNILENNGARSLPPGYLLEGILDAIEASSGFE